MGTSFEGILLLIDRIKEKKSILDGLLEQQTSGAKFLQSELNKEICIIKRIDDLLRVDSRKIEAFAGELSANFDRALLVQYNSTMGYKHSIYFEHGSKIGDFGEDDELFSPYNSDGTTTGEVVRANDVKAEIEYDIIKNAIVLGLEKLGSNSWDDLVEFMFSCRYV